MHLGPSRLQEFHLLFIENPSVSLHHTFPLNPATLLPLPSHSPSPAHSCPELINTFAKPREDLTDLPLPNPDLTLYVDGSSITTAEGQRRAAYTVVTDSATLEAGRLPDGTTSQKAELIALTRALTLAQGKRVNIYTDSKYAFLITHCHSALWKERGFLTTKGSPIVNATQISNLLKALLLPKDVAVIHCRGHQTQQDAVSRGNARADAAAKSLTNIKPAPTPVLFLATATPPVYSPSEKQALILKGGNESDQGWIFLDNKIALPWAQASKIIAEIHQSLHIGPKALYRFVQPLFSLLGLQQTIEQVHKACATCSKVSSQGGLKPQFPTHQMRGKLPAQD
ncbi:uncharacterized protein LOC135273850 [Aotus nancymaae]|uniref:uncharacterized protein LOC135273850 n=1 Tax=Aotus nancymaae TaxID=37293 RepID=UPI0030FE9881